MWSVKGDVIFSRNGRFFENIVITIDISITIDIMVRDEYYYITVISIHYITKIQFMVAPPVPPGCNRADPVEVLSWQGKRAGQFVPRNESVFFLQQQFYYSSVYLRQEP